MQYIQLSTLLKIEQNERITKPLYVEISEIRILERGNKNPNGASVYLLSMGSWLEVEESCEEILYLIEQAKQREQGEEEQEKQVTEKSISIETSNQYLEDLEAEGFGSFEQPKKDFLETDFL